MADEVYVVDPSVAVKWYIPEEYSDSALDLLKKIEHPNVDFYAPSLFKIEFTNAIRKYVVKNLIDKEIADEILDEIERLPINFVDVTWERIKRAFQYAMKRSITVYDALYITIAKELGGKFITADKKVIQSTSGEASIIFITNI